MHEKKFYDFRTVTVIESRFMLSHVFYIPQSGIFALVNVLSVFGADK